ncbi:uncharacterized protein [Malus domestica]|uniref:uncharacterized protein n=1 Tax=Malus domestica TaxID=3750 RepID=UPI0039759945
METFSDFQQQEVDEDALSLCDLPLYDDNGESEENPITSASYSSAPDDLFEFRVDPIRRYIPMDVFFCGKPISPRTQEPLFENPLFSRSESLKFSSPSHPYSHRSPGSELVPAFGTCRSHQQSSNSRKHKVFIGLVKYQPEMDMNEIRKRQSRRAPAPMFPVISSVEQPSVACGKSGSGKGHWGLMRPLRPRTPPTSRRSHPLSPSSPAPAVVTVDEEKELTEESEHAIPASAMRETETAQRRTWRWKRRRGGRGGQWP